MTTIHLQIKQNSQKREKKERKHHLSQLISVWSNDETLERAVESIARAFGITEVLESKRSLRTREK